MLDKEATRNVITFRYVLPITVLVIMKLSLREEITSKQRRFVAKFAQGHEKQKHGLTTVKLTAKEDIIFPDELFHLMVASFK